MKPTEYCPEKRSKVCMSIPQDAEGSTDDSAFGIPGYCNIHTDLSTIFTQPSDSSGEDTSTTDPTESSTVSPLGPGYVQTNPVIIGTVPEEYGPGVH